MLAILRFSLWLLAMGTCFLACCAAPEAETRAPIGPPSTLDEAIAKLRQGLSPEDVAEIRTSSEDMARYHLGWGMSIRNNWGLWSGGPLAQHFNAMGIDHPDDMSGIILASLWRDLNGQPRRVEDQIAHYQQYWRDTAHPEDATCPIHGTALTYRGANVGAEPRNWVHRYRCEGHSETWYWQTDRGFYRPEEANRR